VLDFKAGAVVSLITSFDVWAHNLPCIEIYGTEGTLAVPDPNNFGGPVRLKPGGPSEWRDVPLTHGYAENSRGIGVADMAYAIRENRPHRASGQLGYHVLEAMHGFHDASEQGRHYQMTSTVERPAPLPARWPE
jgi:predicted dehydrogenase